MTPAEGYSLQDQGNMIRLNRQPIIIIHLLSLVMKTGSTMVLRNKRRCLDLDNIHLKILTLLKLLPQMLSLVQANELDLLVDVKPLVLELMITKE